MADERPRSYLVALSPKKQYEELNISLAAQVTDARRNLLDSLEIPAEEECSVNLNVAGDDFVKVYLRVRPFSQEELLKKEDQNCFEVVDCSTVRAIAPVESNVFRNAQHSGMDKILFEFGFSRVFSSDSTQRQVFEATTSDFVKQLIAGQNSLVFSYGVTNAGKTHTIQGSDSDPGIIPKALDSIFNSIKDKLLVEPYFKPKHYNDVVKSEEEDRKLLAELKENVLRVADVEDIEIDNNITNMTKTSSGSVSSLASSSHSSSSDLCSTQQLSTDDLRNVNFEGCEYLVWISFAEIYNEQIYDLFEPLPVGKGKRRNILKLSEDKNGNPFVKGLTEINVTSTEEALKLLIVGQKNLRFASTKLNYNSSRSHCVYNIRVMRVINKAGTLSVQKTSKLTFCDLAGSERSAKTESNNERIKESGCINTSLLNLGRCISTLRYNQTHRDNPQIIPFRDSKLTRIFQNFLVGRGKACMIVNIGQCVSSFDETLHVLKFSAIVKTVKQVPCVTQEPVAPPPTYSLLLRPSTSAKSLNNAKPVSSFKPIPEIEIVCESASKIPLPDDDDVEYLDTTLADNALIQNYQAVIEDLRAQLLEEKRKLLHVEHQVREEVCKEFALHMCEMEDNLCEARKEGIEDAEELADERIELYVQTVQKRQNREKRMTIDPTAAIENEGDGWVPESVLFAEKNKLQEKENEVASLKMELEKKMSDLSKKADAAQYSHVMSGERTTFAEGELLEALEKKNKECQDLSEMLAEAAETFKNNTEEIRRLQEYVAVLEKSLKKNEEENARLLVVESNFRANRDNDSRLELRIAELEELVKKGEKAVASTEPEEVSQSSRPSVSAEPPTTAGNEESMDGCFKLIELESKIFDLEKMLETLTNENKALIDKLSLADDREKKLIEKAADFEKQLHIKTQVALSSGQLRTQLQKAEAKVADLELQLKESQSKETRLKKDCKKAEDDLKTKNEDCQKSELKSRELNVLVAEMTETISQLTEQLQKANVENERLKNRSELVAQELTTLKLEFDKVVKDRQEESAKFTKEADESEETIKRLKADFAEETIRLKAASEDVIRLTNEVQQLAERLTDSVSRLKSADEKMVMDTVKIESLESNFESLKKSLETMTHSLFEKNTKITELEEVNSASEKKIDALDVELKNIEMRHLESVNDLMQQLNDAKVSVLEIKKNKLETEERLRVANEECKNYKHVVATLEATVELEKTTKEKIVEDNLNNEKVIARYQQSAKEQEDLQQKLSESLANRKEEFVQANKDLQEMKAEIQRLESSRVLNEKEILRLKSEVDLKGNVEAKLKDDKLKLDKELLSLTLEFAEYKKNNVDRDGELEKVSAAQMASAQLVENLNTEKATLMNKIEVLTKDLLIKDSCVNALTKKIVQKEQMLHGLDVEVRNFESMHKDAMGAKERQLEAWKQQKEALIDEVEKLKVHEQKLTEENLCLAEAVKLKEEECAKLKAEAENSKLPLTATSRRVKQSSTSVDDDANVHEIEVTPMVCRKPSTSAAARARNSEAVEFPDVSASRRKASAPDAKKKMNEVNNSQPSQLNVKNELIDPESVGAPAKKTAKKPRASTKRSKAVDVLTEESYPISPLIEATTSSEIPQESTGRPTRKAKSTARNGIFAVTEYLRNSPNSGTSASNTNTNIDEGEEAFEDQTNLPPKKRKRTLYKSPAQATLADSTDAEKPKTAKKKS